MNYTVAGFSGSAEYLGNMPSPDVMSAPAKGFQCQPESEVSHSSCSSGCSCHGSPTSLTSYQGVMSERSISSHSLQRSGAHHPTSAPIFADLLVESPVRKVCSAGDLQKMNVMQKNGRPESGMWSESSMIIEGIMSKAHPYSPEEKKVRIERYRIKRHKRNFNKTIKYVCRKTLADNRPRIRGRFAKSEESDQKKSNDMIEEEDYQNWDSFFETLVVANLVHQP